MRLPKETVDSFKQMYGTLSEELYIFFRELTWVGFTADQAIELICAMLSQPHRVDDYKERVHRWDLIKKKLAEREEQKDG